MSLWFVWPLQVLAVGVVTSAGVEHHHGNASVIPGDQRARICAELCRAGLGGTACGPVCFDLLPRTLVAPSSHLHRDAPGSLRHGKARTNACPVLCRNGLGVPLCQCALHQNVDANKNKTTDDQSTSTFELQPVDDQHIHFHEICNHYCLRENLVLRGCPACDNPAAKPNGGDAEHRQHDGEREMGAYKVAIDWPDWCNEQCAINNGGSACNCDLLPFMAGE